MRYTLYKVVKENTLIKGYWLDNSGKVYIDNIKLLECKNKDILKDNKGQLFSEGEKAVFYHDNTSGYIEDNKGTITALNTRLEFKYKVSYENVKAIKDILKNFGGCTVYTKKGHILIEVYTIKKDG